MQTAQELIVRTRAALAENNMLGRLSTWPVKDYFMYTFVSAEYALMRISGEVSKKRIDVAVLKRLMEDYAGVEVFLNPYADKDDNHLLMRMEYITY